MSMGDIQGIERNNMWHVLNPLDGMRFNRFTVTYSGAKGLLCTSNLLRPSNEAQQDLVPPATKRQEKEDVREWTF